jgi:hypothetical protein
MQMISYDFVNSTFTGNCTSGVHVDSQDSPATSFECVNGNFTADLDSSSYLSFIINDLRSNKTTTYTSVDKEWQFPDDAPSLILHDEEGNWVMRTAVTSVQSCEMLKLCVENLTEAQMFVPIGMILIYQGQFAASQTCAGASSD